MSGPAAVPGLGQGRPTMSRSWPFLLLAVGLLGVGLSFWRPIPVGVWHDDGVYMLIGKALAQGEGLTYVGVPGSPPAVKFPPVYPGVLGLLWLVLGSVGPATLAAELLNLVLVASAGGLLAWALHKGGGVRRRDAVIIAGLAFVSAEVWRTALIPLSEALFMALAAGTMAAWPAAGKVGDRRGALVLSMLLVVAVLTRSAGVALVAGFALALMLRRGVGVALAVSAPPLAATAAWSAWASAHASEIPEGMRDVLGPYGAWLAGQSLSAPAAFVRSLPDHALIVGNRVVSLLIPGVTGWPLWLAAAPLLALAIWGVAQLARSFPPLVWVPLAYLAMLMAWPFLDSRLVAPVHAWMVVWVGFGVLSLSERWKGPRLRALLGVVVFAWVGAYGSVTASRAARGWALHNYQIRAGRLAAAVEALQHTAPADAVVGAAEFWAALHLHGGWLSVPSARFTPRPEDDATPVWGTPAEQLDLWWHAGVDYVLLEQGGTVHGGALDLLDGRCPGSAAIVARMPPQLLVKLTWDDACAASLGLTDP